MSCNYTGTKIALPGTENDAAEMKQTFERFGYDIIQLKNENATYYAILKELRKISIYLSEYNGGTADKVIIFAFSGHGTTFDCMITQDFRKLSLTVDIIPLLVYHLGVVDIPKLFFIDACRGSQQLKSCDVEESLVDDISCDVEESLVDDMKKFDAQISKNIQAKGFKEQESNYRIDYATIPGHVAYCGPKESKWMPVLARKLREENDSIQNIAAMVKQEVAKWQQAETLDRLKTGILYLHKRLPQ